MRIAKIILSVVFMVVVSAALSQGVFAQGGVCPNPAAPCSPLIGTNNGPSQRFRFEANSLSFNLPRKLEWLNSYNSADFYAVILESRPAVKSASMDDEKCKQGFYSEAERRRVQKLFPARKVFTSRNGCYLPMLSYTNINAEREIIAVYAGKTLAEANRFLRQAKAKGYASANVRKMKVDLYYGD